MSRSFLADTKGIGPRRGLGQSQSAQLNHGRPARECCGASRRLGTTVSAERDRVAGFGRLEDGLLQAGEWYRWGPYVSERQWGTVREDYSADGEAWDYATLHVLPTAWFRNTWSW